MGFASWLRYCTDVAQRRSSKLPRYLAVSWADTLYIHFRWLLPPSGIFPGAKFILRPIKSCVLLYWQRYCTAPEQWALAKLCGIFTRQSGHPVRHWAVELSSYIYIYTETFQSYKVSKSTNQDHSVKNPWLRQRLKTQNIQMYCASAYNAYFTQPTLYETFE